MMNRNCEDCGGPIKDCLNKNGEYLRAVDVFNMAIALFNKPMCAPCMRTRREKMDKRRDETRNNGSWDPISKKRGLPSTPPPSITELKTAKLDRHGPGVDEKYFAIAMDARNCYSISFKSREDYLAFVQEFEIAPA